MKKDMSELEILLNRENFFYDPNVVDESKTYNTNNLQKAKGNASLLDFIDMVALILSNVTSLSGLTCCSFGNITLLPVISLNIGKSYHTFLSVSLSTEETVQC